MPVAASFQDLVDLGKAEAQSRRTDLSYHDGDVTEAQLHGGAAMADTAIGYAARAFKETFLDGAKEDALTRLVADRVGINRKAASVAQVTVAFSRAATVLGGSVAAGTQVATDFTADGGQVVFETTGALSFGIGVAGPLSVLCNAVVAGRGGNVKATAVTKVLSTLFDTFTVTNALPAAGGNDEEADEDLRDRARKFWSTVRRGTRAAIEYGAKLVPSVVIATAIEDQTTGVVTLRVADSFGNSTAQMVSDVQAELENWRAAGAVVEVLGGILGIVDFTIKIKVRDSFDVTAASTLISAAVISRISKLGVGETLYLDSIIAAVIGVAPDDILDVQFDTILLNTVAQAIADVVPTVAMVLRGGTVSVSELT